jgi:hypothetical protein
MGLREAHGRGSRQPEVEDSVSQPREPRPELPPGIFIRCDAGHCASPADGWLWDQATGRWIPACRACLAREAEWDG